eukprot:TRINITY_DN1885_c0_g1_i1.p1 TRINITY_DN1885_c0_g1~~TRINITY_DN1885_c0_g1_i1.p1  ORF type:complete len:345 (+),score=-26.54 TRINITY_DN1885_c0_g1_i1:518-1552(+)
MQLTINQPILFQKSKKFTIIYQNRQNLSKITRQRICIIRVGAFQKYIQIQSTQLRQHTTKEYRNKNCSLWIFLFKVSLPSFTNYKMKHAFFGIFILQIDKTQYKACPFLQQVYNKNVKTWTNTICLKHKFHFRNVTVIKQLQKIQKKYSFIEHIFIVVIHSTVFDFIEQIVQHQHLKNCFTLKQLLSFKNFIINIIINVALINIQINQKFQLTLIITNSVVSSLIISINITKFQQHVPKFQMMNVTLVRKQTRISIKYFTMIKVHSQSCKTKVQTKHNTTTTYSCITLSKKTQLKRNVQTRVRMFNIYFILQNQKQSENLNQNGNKYYLGTWNIACFWTFFRHF